MKMKSIFQMRLAGYLMQNGIGLMGLTRNKKTGLFVYLFEDTEQLQNAISDYMKTHRYKGEDAFDSGLRNIGQ